MSKKKVFVSFDFDNDKILKEFIVGQALLPDSPFEITDTSLKEAQPLNLWEEKARAAIRRSDIVLVMVGTTTCRAPGVIKEVRMAQEARVPIVQIIGYRDTNPTPVAGCGQLVRWSWDNLKHLLS
jgi:hypothetical protein